MKTTMKSLVGIAALFATSSAFAMQTTEERLIEKGLMPEPVTPSQMVRTVPAELESATERTLVENGLIPRPVERVYQTEQRRHDPQFSNRTEERLVEKGLLPARGNNISVLVGEQAQDGDSGS